MQSGKIGILPYNLDLDYKYWTFHDIMRSILPESLLDDIPGSFQSVGHVAHMNLREPYLPYKQLIAQVLLDKTPHRTVINKIDNVGDESEFRTFKYEVLGGPDDLSVAVREQDCTFHFDYSKVYWNSRLGTEHERIVQQFKKGDAVCDVMAGVGPFAIPAGRKGVFVLANDLNPSCYEYLKGNVNTNKVSEYVHYANMDGHKFIPIAAAWLYKYPKPVRVKLAKVPKSKPPVSFATGPKAPKADEGEVLESGKNGENGSSSPAHQPRRPRPYKEVTRPQHFSHYVMNLPAIAIAFLPDFVGLYHPDSTVNRQFGVQHPDNAPMPMIHVYTFAAKFDDESTNEVCAKISKLLGTGVSTSEPETTVHDVRDVAPKKRMLCVSFRLPAEVAWRKPSPEKLTDSRTEKERSNENIECLDLGR